jgi:hypothetical protein
MRDQKREMPLPGVAAIALYLLLIAGIIILGVVGGGHYPAVYLLFSVVFVASSAGLIASFRWAWVLALAAVFLLMVYNVWVFTAQHEAPAAVQGALNLIFFLYLVRPEVRMKMR